MVNQAAVIGGDELLVDEEVAEIDLLQQEEQDFDEGTEEQTSPINIFDLEFQKDLRIFCHFY